MSTQTPHQQTTTAPVPAALGTSRPQDTRIFQELVLGSLSPKPEPCTTFQPSRRSPGPPHKEPQAVWGLPRPDGRSSPLGKAGLGHPKTEAGWMGGVGAGSSCTTGTIFSLGRISVAGEMGSMGAEGGSGTRRGARGSRGTRTAGEGAAPCWGPSAGLGPLTPAPGAAVLEDHQQGRGAGAARPCRMDTQTAAEARVTLRRAAATRVPAPRVRKAAAEWS